MSTELNRETIERFYAAFDRHDGETMAACYRPDAHFRDPAFGDLSGERAGSMWRMLTGRSEDLRVELPEHDAGESSGSAHWIARYTFNTGRTVVNDIRAEFRFDDDGLIVEHIDSFSFWAWSRQALGPIGLILGWTPILPAMTRRKALAQLDEYESAGK
ncbi:MAG: nuclear transport factor 2 family protein [Solirubrobacterales bacterium]